MAEYEIERVCPVCGKRFEVLYKNQWAYKKTRAKGGYDFYCSWKCLRADEVKRKTEPKPVPAKQKKGVDKMSQNKLTREQKGKAVDIAIQGGDPLVYLKECGAKNPTAAWWYIKKTLATKNPQLLEKIPEKIGTVLNESGQVAARVEIAEKLPPEAAAEVPEADPLAGFVPVSLGGPVAMSREEHKEAHKGFKVTALEETDDGVRFVMSVPPEQAEQMDKVLKDMMDPEKDALCMSLHNPPKENRIRYTVMSIKTKAGTFSINEETEKISWSGGASCTVMEKKDWEDLAEVLPEVLEILGEVNG